MPFKKDAQPAPTMSHQSIANQMSSLSELLPNIIEAAASSAALASSAGSAADTLPSASIPNELKSRLHDIFKQIEHEFDLIYAENLRLHQQLLATAKPADNLNESMTNKESSDRSSSNDSSPRTTTANQLKAVANTGMSSSGVGSLSFASTLTSSAASALATTSLSAKSALLSSKNRINNISFPKFKPNAKEFMQSIRNTSAQIVNKTQNHGLSSKLRCSLTGHKDGYFFYCNLIINYIRFYLINVI